MRYKCHYCSEFLKPGMNYTLECDCGNCNIGFEKSGKVNSFLVAFFEKGKDFFLLKSKDSEKISYGYKKGLYIEKPMDKSPFFKSYFLQSEFVLQVETSLQFDEEGVPQVYKLWEKLDKLKAFS